MHYRSIAIVSFIRLRNKLFYSKKNVILLSPFAHITHRMKLPKCWMSLFGIRLIRLENTRIFQFSFEFESRTPSSSVLNVDSSNSRTIVGKKGDYHVQNFITAGSRSTPRKKVPMPSKFPKSYAVGPEHSVCVRKLCEELDTKLNEQKEGYLASY